MTISKRTSLGILVVTALTFSRAMFALFNDPEGPNLLIVTVMAGIIFGLSLAIYSFLPLPKEYGPKKLSVTLLLQAFIVTVFYLCLN